jgi:hypothetical protein
MASSGSESDASDGGSSDSSISGSPPPRRLRWWESLSFNSEANAVATRHLAAWLRLHYPRDVLMPGVRGEKRPAHTHAGGSWTWARFEWAAQHTAARGAPPLGILLYDLCVVDCDTVADADALEAAYPELTRTAMETTQRGRHYYFARSPLADAHGYYDGAAQRRPRVDFKSRCWGGGSGFVVVAPSEHKARDSNPVCARARARAPARATSRALGARLPCAAMRMCVRRARRSARIACLRRACPRPIRATPRLRPPIRAARAP